MTAKHPNIGVVAIGRNEGERLKRCLLSILSQEVPVVYVDSGSSDGSVAFAQAHGVPVVTLDMSIPFTAARGRNEGYAELISRFPDLEFVQFLDGDCALDPEWIAAAVAALNEDAHLGVVTGWRSELYPDASVYNAICDLEWHAPANPIEACGGDMAIRCEAFEAAGWFNEQVVAAEDDEFCIRVGQKGFSLLRFPLNMTYHDADMHSFGQWWKRAIRAGHGFAQVGDLHSGYFAAPRKRVLIFGAVLPIAAFIGIIVSKPLFWCVIALYVGSFVRTAYKQFKSHSSLTRRQSLHHSVLMVISKFPNLIGFCQYYLRKMRGDAMQIIEYK